MRDAPFVQDHPVDPESILHLREPAGEEGFLHRHQHASAIGQSREDPFGLGVAIHAQRK